MKWVLVALAGVVLLIVGVGFTIPPRWTVTRTVDVAAPVDVVSPLALDVRRWTDWTEWNVQHDPGVKWSYSGTPGVAGFIAEWHGPQMGNGRIRVTAVDPNRSVSFEVIFNWHEPSTGTIAVTPRGSGSQVSWTMAGDTGMNPIMRLYLPRIRTEIGEQLSEDLNRLAELAAKKP